MIRRFLFASSRSFAHHHDCPSCGITDLLKDIVCRNCKIIVPVDILEKKNEFDILGMKEDIEIDLKELGDKYKHIQRYLHPDKFVVLNNKKLEQHSKEAFNLVLDAYKVLGNNFTRANALLKIKGAPYVKDESNFTDQEFIEDMMDLSEEIMESESISDVMVAHSRITAQISQHWDSVKSYFKEEDYESAYNSLARMNVLEKKLLLCDSRMEQLRS